MSPEKIISLQNPRIKNLVKLRDRRPRDEQGVFLLEGYRAISRAVEKGAELRELYFAPEWFLGKNETSLIKTIGENGVNLFELAKHTFAKVAYRDRPEGLLAVASQWKTHFADLHLPETPLLLVVEAIEKPGNMGMILRSADAAGVDAVIVCDPVTDLFNPNVVRSSTGVLFSVPVVIESTKNVIAYLETNKIRSVATTPSADSLYSDTDLNGPLALIMGSEQFGLSDTWLAQATDKVRIPMAGQADSLNVAMATIVTLFEAVRQRTLS